MYLDLILLLLIENVVFQEVRSKKYMLISQKDNNFKIVLVLLKKVVVFYMQIAIVKVGILVLERSIKIIPRTC